MFKQIFIVHGGNTFEKYEEYLANLKTKDVSIEKLHFKDWKRNLSETLGDEYQVIAPSMPNSQNARFIEWKIWFERFMPFLNDQIILIGHSLGGIFLAKYLSESIFPKKIRSTFLVAAPFKSDNDESLVDFELGQDLSKLSAQGGVIFLFHSKDDPVVEYPNVLEYKKALPNAILRSLDTGQHFNQAEFPELVEEIKSFK